MSNLEKMIEEIDKELTLKGRDLKSKRENALYAVQSLKVKLLSDNDLLTDEEIIEVYEHYLNGNYGFEYAKGWIKTKDRIININNISNIKISSEDSKHFCEIVATLTTQVRVKQGDDFISINENVRLTDFLMQSCMAKEVLDSIFFSLQFDR